jgi:hypothetical protein
LDAADSSTVTGTTTVTQWRDKSGNARHLGVGSGTTSYSSNAIVLNSSYMFVNSPVNLTNVTVFIVSKSTGVTNQTILGAKPNTDYVYNSVDGFGFYKDPPTGRIRFYGQGNDPNQSIFFTDTSITKLYTFQSTGTTVSGWLNGTSQSGGTLTTTRTSTAQGFAIGAEWGGSSYVNIWVTASIYEILVYNTALTASERQQVEGYLAHKWGLVQLSSTTPLSIPGCQLWLDAADSSTVSGTTTVTQWRDKSGNARHLGVGSGTTSYSSNAIKLNSSYMFVTSPVDLSKLSVFLVSKSNNLWNQPVFVIRPNTSLSYNSTDGLQIAFYDQIINIFSQDLTQYTDSGLINTTLITAQASDRTLTTWLNGTNQKSVTNSSARTSTAQGFAIGAEWGNGSYHNAISIASINELIVFNEILTTTQRQTIETYLAKKWGIGASTIPSTHPFSSIRPHLRPFQPIDVPGCQLWLDGADTGSMTFSSGSNLSVWKDKSGYGNNFSLTSGTTSNINDGGYSVVNFPSGAIMSSANQITFTTSSAFFIVSKLTSLSASTISMVVGFTNINDGDLTFVRYNPSAILNGTAATTTSERDLGNNNYYVNGTFNPSTFGSNVYLNVYSIIGTVSPITGGTSFLTLSSGFSSRFFIGNIAEFLYYPGGVTSSQRQQVEGYLAHKWGLSQTYATNTPLSIPGSTMWLDGADPAGTGVIPSDGTLATWVDKSGNGRNGVQFSTFARPQFVANSLNSRGGVSFNAASSNCYQTQSVLPTPGTIFVVGFTSDGGFCLSGIPNPNSGHPPYYVSFARDVEFGVNNTSDTPFLANVSTSFNTNYILTGLYTGSNVSVIINGGTLSNTVSFSGTPKTPATTLIGLNSYANGLGAALTGTINEMITYNTALTTSQRQQVEGYLARKWGLTLSGQFISTHPFKSIPPATLPFSPRNITGLAFWLDAADQNAMTLSGSSVVTVLDKSRNGKTLTGGTGWSYNVTKFNGTYPSFYRATTGSMLGQNSTFSLTSTNITLFFVGMLESAGSTTSAVYFIDGGGVNTGRFYNYVDYSGGVDTIYIYHGDTQTTASYPITNRRIVSPFIFSQSTGTNPQTGSINGIAFNASGGNTGSMTVTGLTIGGPWNSTVSGALPYTWPGHICEVLIYSSALTTSERQQVEGYLAHKWGLTGYYAPTTPLSIPGCALWLDGSDTSSMTLSGSNVTAWNDKSGNGYVMTNNQGTTSISTASLNSLTTVYTPSGTNSKITNFVGRTKCTIFLVGKAASSRYLLSLNGGFLYTANDSLLYFSPPTGNYLDLVDSVSGSIVSNNTWFILCIGYDNATNSTANPYTINGTTRSTTITPRGTPGILTDQNITSTLYINSTNGTNSYDSVYTAEILYYNRTLTNSERQTIEGYLAKKWGIGASTIPSTHPYSKLPPA